MARHVAACARCRARVDEARDGAGLGGAGDGARARPFLLGRLPPARGARARRERRPRRSRRPLWAAADGRGGGRDRGRCSFSRGRRRRSPRLRARFPRCRPGRRCRRRTRIPALPILELVAPVVAAAAPTAECADVAECVAGLTDEESGDAGGRAPRPAGAGEDPVTSAPVPSCWPRLSSGADRNVRVAGASGHATWRSAARAATKPSR